MRKWRVIFRRDPEQAAYCVGNAQQRICAHDGPEYYVIAQALGKTWREVDFMTLDPREAVQAVMTKKISRQFDWAAYDRRWKHWLWSTDAEGGVFDEDLHRQFQADLEANPLYQEYLAECENDPNPANEDDGLNPAPGSEP